MSSTTILELISSKVNQIIAKELIPKFSEVAAEVVSNFGDEPPSKESMTILFQDAFAKILTKPKEKKVKEPKEKKAKEPKEKKAKEPKEKKEKKIVPKPQWLTKKEMEETLVENEGQKYYCGFVAERGPNKGKFCACELTEEAKNCGIMTDDKEWKPHSPEEEVKESGGKLHARCKKCWTTGKNGSYRKVGAYDKMYNPVKPESPKPKKKSTKKEKKDEIPEIPQLPQDNEIKVEDDEEDNEIKVEDEDIYGAETEEEPEVEDTAEEPEEEPEVEDTAESVEDILDGLLD